MKTSIFIYTVGLILIAACIALMLLYPESGRYQMIAGGLMLAGFALNIAGFALKRTTSIN